MEKIISYLKQRGFIWQSGQIYGGLAAVYDWGAYGLLLKDNLKQLWRQRFINEREDILPIETSLLTKKEVLAASGHLKNFADPLVECRTCHGRFRAGEITSGHCPTCGGNQLTKPRQFNLMFSVGEEAFLRPETAQGMFVNFANVVDNYRVKLPFGLAQIGRAFRNEITVGNSIFRTREFEQAEIEYFVRPEEAEKWFTQWVDEWEKFFWDIGLTKDNLRRRPHSKEELAHYSQATTDIEYRFPFGASTSFSANGEQDRTIGWAELAGVANRTDYDLKNHTKASGEELVYFDSTTKQKITPWVIEPTLGIERLVLALICQGLRQSDGRDGREKGERILALLPSLAPVKAGVFPLVKKEPLVKLAREIFLALRRAGIYCQYDEVGSIGRRYRRQDEIGTPWCITVDFDSLEDNQATIRNRDTLKQERVAVGKIEEWIKEKLRS